ncbi:MAG: NapC/NirT family cytochrome c [Desulfovibrionaceae bacterium]|jgi:cytochrome c-type protein NapC|nr:NapC/NirT family cytochrome c [Desulfovibrionaceae bacterium]
MSSENPGFLRRTWQALHRPSAKHSVFTLLLAGFVVALVVSDGFNSTLGLTNTTAFCTSCHTMKGNFEEYKKTIHYSSRSGVRAGCPDCHVPHNFASKIFRKLEAAQDVWGEITGVVDTPEKFEARRMKMATEEWERMKASGSATCRSCHDFDGMSLEKQGKTRYDKHMKAKADGQTCIDCHKGIAHKLPKEYHDPDEDE